MRSYTACSACDRTAYLDQSPQRPWGVAYSDPAAMIEARGAGSGGRDLAWPAPGTAGPELAATMECQWLIVKKGQAAELAASPLVSLINSQYV